jgi:hypothetical protein
MTSYAPPTIDYFSGLQFNPNIYENTVVQGVSKVFGALVTIIGTISAIITAPIIQLIGSTSVEVFSPLFRHRLSSGGAIQLSITSTQSSLTNATSTTIFSPDTKINGSGTSAVSTTIGNGVAGGTLLLNNVNSELRGSSLKVASTTAVTPFDFNFFTSTTNPTVQSANIEVSGGNALTNQGTMSLEAAFTNLNAINTICNGEMTFNNNVAFSSGTSTFGSASALRFTTASGTYPMYINAPILGIQTGGTGGTITAPAWNSIQRDAIFYFSNTTSGTWSYVLPTTYRIGNRCMIMNFGTGNVNISVSGGAARIYGVGALRTGNTSFTIAGLVSASIECVDGTNIISGGGNFYLINVR